MSRAGLALCCLALLASSLFAVAPLPREQWIVVVAPGYRKAIAPLVEHRRAQGLRVTEVVADADAKNLRDRVRSLWSEHAGPSSVLLVGAAFAPLGSRPEDVVVPPFSGTIGRMRGQPSDAAYGCREGERMPRVAVGRFPARDVDDVRTMVANTLRVERDQSAGAWRERLTILAGVPAYNAVVDRLVENAALARFERLAPRWTGRVVYTNPSSRFCLPAADLRKKTLAYLRDGQAFILYLGHSHAEGLYAGPQVDFLDRDDWRTLHLEGNRGMFLTFGCHGCQLRGRDGEGYGVAAMRNPHGPAAVFGSHGACYAAMAQLAADGLFQRCFSAESEAVTCKAGDCYLGALQGIATGKIDFLSYRLLDGVDGDPKTPQDRQRQEHLEMFVLLGDPALRLPRPTPPLVLDAPTIVVPGKQLTIRGTLPMQQAEVRVLLERTPTSTPTKLAVVPARGAERDQALRDNHDRANDFVVATATVQAQDGRFATQVEVPGVLPWTAMVLRVRARSKNGIEALAVQRLKLSRVGE